MVYQGYEALLVALEDFWNEKKTSHVATSHVHVDILENAVNAPITSINNDQ